MSKKTRNLKRSNSLKTDTLTTSSFKNLNYDDFSSLNRFATRKTRRKDLASDLSKRQSFFDRRFFRPERQKIYDYSFQTSHVKASLKKNFATLHFERPTKEPVCKRRQARKEVLFALGLTGKGAGASKHSWTDESKISCKK